MKYHVCPSHSVKIQVEDPRKGLVVTLEVEPECKVASLREAACSALGLTPEPYVLSKDYRLLDESSTLFDEGVREGDRLVLILRSVWEALRREP